MKSLLKTLRPAIGLLIILTVVTGVLYPLVVTVISQVVFPYQANGSIMMQNGTPVGSELIGQGFDADPRYFWGRPSDLTPEYAAVNLDLGAGSGASNYGPSNPALVASGQDKDANGTPIPEGTIQTRIDALTAANQAAGVTVAGPIPADLVTDSYSGLDPAISPAAAYYQIPRVAKLRGLTEDALRKLVDQFTTGRTLGILGEPTVNVLKLNLALDVVPGQLPPPTAMPAATAIATEAATSTTVATPVATAAQ